MTLASDLSRIVYAIFPAAIARVLLLLKWQLPGSPPKCGEVMAGSVDPSKNSNSISDFSFTFLEAAATCVG